MNYVELLAENDKNLAKIEALEAQLKPANIQQFLTFAAIEDMSTKQINEVFTELHENNVSAMAKLKASQEHISQLTAQIEELKAQVVDAVGDGFYDGYLACAKDAREDSFDSFTITDSDVLRLSEQHESEHRYSKSINDIKASAIDSINVVDFVEMALRHTTIKGEFDFNDVKDAFSYLSKQLRSKCKGGAA
jgi:uncharacterized protein YhaN